MSLSSSVISISVFVAGSPLILEAKPPSTFKEVLELNEIAYSQIIQRKARSPLVLNDNYGTMVFFDSLLKNYKEDNFIIILATQSINEYVVEDMYLNPA